VRAETGADHAEAVDDAGDGAHQARAHPVEQEAADRRPDPEEEDGEGERQSDVGPAPPVVEALKRYDEDAPGVDRPERQLHDNRGGGNSPPGSVERCRPVFLLNLSCHECLLPSRDLYQWSAGGLTTRVPLPATGF